MQIPGFAVGSDMLSCVEHFSTVHTGAVFQRHAVSKVILILVVWAVTATIAGLVCTLEITKRKYLAEMPLMDQSEAT